MIILENDGGFARPYSASLSVCFGYAMSAVMYYAQKRTVLRRLSHHVALPVALCCVGCRTAVRFSACRSVSVSVLTVNGCM